MRIEFGLSGEVVGLKNYRLLLLHRIGINSIALANKELYGNTTQIASITYGKLEHMRLLSLRDCALSFTTVFERKIITTDTCIF